MSEKEKKEIEANRKAMLPIQGSPARCGVLCLDSERRIN